jgi:hypothetical protein
MVVPTIDSAKRAEGIPENWIRRASAMAGTFFWRSPKATGD